MTIQQIPNQSTPKHCIYWTLPGQGATSVVHAEFGQSSNSQLGGILTTVAPEGHVAGRSGEEAEDKK